MAQSNINTILSLLSSYVEYSNYYMANCPFHSPDSHPSLMIFKDVPGFKCLACSEHGGYAKLENELKGYVAPTIAQTKVSHAHNLSSDLAECESECNEAHRFLLEKYDPLASYLIQRKVENRITPQRIGYFDGWYTIPVYNNRNEFIGAVQRASPSKQSETGLRFSTPKDQKPLVYIPDYSLVDNSDRLYVTFGMFDCLSLCELGLPSCTPTAGKNSLHPEMLSWVRKPIIVLPDKGEENTAHKLIGGLGWRGLVQVLDYPENCKDISDMHQRGYADRLLEEIAS